jgi:centromere protein I
LTSSKPVRPPPLPYNSNNPLAATVPKRNRATETGPYVADVAEHGHEHGFHAPELLRILRLVSARTELDQSSLTSLLRNLYPAEKVASDAVLLAVAGLGPGAEKPSAATQAGLVRWVVGVQGVLEEPEFLARVYGLLFNLLDMVSLR